MAPRATTPGRKKLQRETHYFDVGVQGRKTGITLQENARDEHGIEKLDGLFSSPEKSSPKRRITNGNAGNSTLTSSSMKVQESSGPEPTEVLSSRRLLKSSKTTFPPPAGRSPFKTNIGSSPRRQTSVAPPASRPLSSSPIRATSAQPAVNRRLDFSVDQIRQSVEVSPRPVRSAKRPNGTRVAQTRQRDIFSLQPSVSPARANGSDHAEDEESEDEYRAKALAYDIIEETVGRDDGPMFNGDDDAYEAPLDHGEEEEDINQPISSPLKVTGTGKPRGRPSKPSAKKLGQAPILEPGSSARKTRQSLLSNPEETPPIAPVAVMQSASKTKKGKAPQVEEEDEPQEVIEDVDESAIPTSAGKKRGRSAKLPVHQDEEPEEEVAESVEPPAKKQRKTKAKAPRERDPNKKMGPPSAAPNAKRSMSPSKRPTQPRTLTMLRAETPANENMQRTRSGRTIIKPLAHWLGEKAEHNYDGSLLEVIRAQSVDVSRSKSQRGSVAPKGGKSTKARRQKQKADSMDAIEEEEGMEAGEEEQEEWEVAGQILRGPVKVWDNVAQRTIDEEEIQDLAISSGAMDPREVAGGEFEYTKFISLAFFGCGMVDLPPGGIKRPKNVRKMQMMFFVHAGKVIVTVNDTEFAISKGGVFNVARGNTYSIRNDGEIPAKVLFAQACETEVFEDE